MKKLLALLALCGLIFTACENSGDEQTNQTEQPEQSEQNNANLTLNITSPSNGILMVPCIGGIGEIEYTLTEVETLSTANANLTATADADWISNISIESSKIVLTIDQNEDAERMCYVTIKYKQQTKIVVVKQDGYILPDVSFKATHLNGSYWGKFPTTTGFNYLVILGDRRSPHYLTKESGATEYRFNIYSDVSSAFNKIHRVPVGTYKIDHSSSGRPGTIDGDKDQSYYFSANGADVKFVDAVMVVTERSIIVDATLMGGETHHVEYHGDLVYEGYTMTDQFGSNYPVWSDYTSDITFDITEGFIDVYYRGDYYGTGCDVWFISLMEEKVNGHYNGSYLLLDLIIPKSAEGVNNLDAIEGEYTIFYDKPDNYEYTAPGGRFRDDNMQWHAWYMKCINGQGDLSTAAPFRSGSIKVTVNNSSDLTFVFDGVDDAGNKIIGTFTGFVNNWFDQSCE
jgi:hypothetical protein